MPFLSINNVITFLLLQQIQFPNTALSLLAYHSSFLSWEWLSSSKPPYIAGGDFKQLGYTADYRDKLHMTKICKGLSLT